MILRADPGIKENRAGASAPSGEPSSGRRGTKVTKGGRARTGHLPDHLVGSVGDRVRAVFPGVVGPIRIPGRPKPTANISRDQRRKLSSQAQPRGRSAGSSRRAAGKECGATRGLPGGNQGIMAGLVRAYLNRWARLKECAWGKTPYCASGPGASRLRGSYGSGAAGAPGAEVGLSGAAARRLAAVPASDGRSGNDVAVDDRPGIPT
jgi:hypothetical protein